MPPPTVVCSVCNQSVLKAQTYHIGDGKRACKSHEGVVEAKSKLEADAAKKIEDDKIRKRLEDERRGCEREASLDPIAPRCFMCLQKGMHACEFYAKLAIGSKKEQLKGSFINPLSDDYPRRIRQAAGVGNTPVLFQFPCEKDNPVLKKLGRDQRSVVDIMGMIMLCGDCSDKNGFKLDLPTPDIKTLGFLGAIMDPCLTELGKKALDEEAGKN